jgi:hypothetical protein
LIKLLIFDALRHPSISVGSRVDIHIRRLERPLHRHVPVIGIKRFVGIMIVHHWAVAGLGTAVAEVKAFGNLMAIGDFTPSANRSGPSPLLGICSFVALKLP